MPSATILRLPQIPEERPPSRDRQKENLPQNFSAAILALPLLLCSRLSLKDQHGCILREIQSALVTLPAMVLDMPARRAGETDRIVAAGTEMVRHRVILAASIASHH